MRAEATIAKGDDAKIRTKYGYLSIPFGVKKKAAISNNIAILKYENIIHHKIPDVCGRAVHRKIFLQVSHPTEKVKIIEKIKRHSISTPIGIVNSLNKSDLFMIEN